MKSIVLSLPTHLYYDNLNNAFFALFNIVCHDLKVREYIENMDFDLIFFELIKRMFDLSGKIDQKLLETIIKFIANFVSLLPHLSLDRVESYHVGIQLHQLHDQHAH